MKLSLVGLEIVSHPTSFYCTACGRSVTYGRAIIAVISCSEQNKFRISGFVPNLECGCCTEGVVGAPQFFMDLSEATAKSIELSSVPDVVEEFISFDISMLRAIFIMLHLDFEEIDRQVSLYAKMWLTQ